MNNLSYLNENLKNKFNWFKNEQKIEKKNNYIDYFSNYTVQVGGATQRVDGYSELENDYHSVYRLKYDTITSHDFLYCTDIINRRFSILYFLFSEDLGIEYLISQPLDKQNQIRNNCFDMVRYIFNIPKYYQVSLKFDVQDNTIELPFTELISQEEFDNWMNEIKNYIINLTNYEINVLKKLNKHRPAGISLDKSSNDDLKKYLRSEVNRFKIIIDYFLQNDQTALMTTSQWLINLETNVTGNFGLFKMLHHALTNIKIIDSQLFAKTKTLDQGIIQPSTHLSYMDKQMMTDDIFQTVKNIQLPSYKNKDETDLRTTIPDIFDPILDTIYPTNIQEHVKEEKDRVDNEYNQIKSKMKTEKLVLNDLSTFISNSTIQMFNKLYSPSDMQLNEQTSDSPTPISTLKLEHLYSIIIQLIEKYIMNNGIVYNDQRDFKRYSQKSIKNIYLNSKSSRRARINRLYFKQLYTTRGISVYGHNKTKLYNICERLFMKIFPYSAERRVNMTTANQNSHDGVLKTLHDLISTYQNPLIPPEMKKTTSLLMQQNNLQMVKDNSNPPNIKMNLFVKKKI